MSKQTAVEWLVSEYAKAFKISVNAVMGETIEKAKAMEKEQHCTTYINAMKECMINPLGDELYLEDAKQYYNETYGGRQMKGTLMKTDQGWMVNCNYSINKNDWETLPLHPEFIEMMDTCFTSKFTNEIEFEIVTEWENGEVGVNGLTYAKLINNVPNVVEDDVEKLALEWNNGEMPMHYHKREGFKSGYNKAKETLYTEEQVRKAYFKGAADVHDKCTDRTWRGVETKVDIELLKKLNDKYIQSLKQGGEK